MRLGASGASMVVAGAGGASPAATTALWTTARANPVGTLFQVRGTAFLAQATVRIGET